MAPSSTIRSSTSRICPCGLDRDPDGRQLPARVLAEAPSSAMRWGPRSFKQECSSCRWFACGRARRRDGTFEGAQRRRQRRPRRLALIGVRPCDLRAIAIQDRVLGGRYADRDYAARREDAFILAVNCQAGRHLLLRLDGHRPAARRLRPRADRTARGRAPLPRRRRAPTRVRRSSRLAPRRLRGPTTAPPGAWSRPTGWAGMDPRDIRALLRDEPRASALGRRRRALPDLRQLHHGLPDLLLHRPSRTRPTSPATRRALAALGLVLRPGLLLSPRRRGPTVAQPATGSGSRTSSAPGTTSSAGPAASAVAAASPGARSASTSPRRSPRSAGPGRRRRKTLDAARRREPVPRRARPPYLELVAGCAPNAGFDAGRILFREGDPADTFWLIRPAGSRSRPRARPRRS